ncbi:FAD/NAD(P)-binding protein [Luteimonas sp. Y-2-2-4F]|nr:FAD/NAD(P)-binding protein [Luteimonas sp. Y-2-2-4F]MCD9032079.1 FAD/NAD(P)-binding protein [Luteimonas sp. Y-2-2-4F]
MEPDHDVAIAGGGASAVLLALQLRRRWPGCRIGVAEPAARLGAGAAYATRQDEHLLNVPAGGMSADPDAPGDFVDHLRAQGFAADVAARYVPRRLYHDYLAARLRVLPGAAPHHARAEAVGYDPAGCALLLASGERLRARAVVLATGNRPRGLPVEVPAQAAGRVIGAWDHDAVAALPAAADVAIVGTGLSMVDAALGLHARGHRGRIVALSRHALLPLPHAAPGEAAVDLDALLALPLRARLHALRREAAALRRDGRPWQWLMQALRPHGVALWRSLGDADRARFLRHAVRYWDVHRHRIAPEAAAVLDAMIARGDLSLAQARLEAIAPEQGRLRLDARARDGRALQWRVDAAIDATGIETRLAHSADPLLAALREAGLVRAGPCGLGLDVDADGAVRDAGGRARDDLYAIGSLRIGAEWESVAIPELRVQAARIAARLAAHGG